ncbi:MAG: hypothetical protein JO056_06020 [Alphaproteobacteria bacterium]|uniref:hypothetical protein n=1 Tax=Bradyrhizobium sp. TaxID=376 RepID=UPI001EC1CBEC|nr:hypothetical protein [Bradyrhizobium sp.]MBV9570778.1 hypothetical protein [Alphaproteobacteria bacterium]MBV9979029.1 hypothetical protein [Bradyrhizobium sp.]
MNLPVVAIPFIPILAYLILLLAHGIHTWLNRDVFPRDGYMIDVLILLAYGMLFGFYCCQISDMA